MRTKFSQVVLKSDGTPFAGGFVNVLRTGAVINETQTIGTGTLEIDVYHHGSLAAGDKVQVLSGSTLNSTQFDVDTLTDNGSDWTITFSSQSGDDVAATTGDRLVLYKDPDGALGHVITLYADDMSTRQLSNFYTLGTDGMLEFWCDENNVDLYIYGTGVESTYRVDLSAGGEDIKSTFDEITGPTVNDDEGDGFSAGSRWIDATSDEEYVCLDPTSGAAVWSCTTNDGTAIHRNIAGEVNAITTKSTALVAGDVFLIEDSEAGYVKKRVQVSNLPAGAESNNLEDSCTGIATDEIVYGASAGVAAYGKISTLTQEAAPGSGDKFLIEDSGGTLKYVDVDDLPAGSETNSLETTCTDILEGEIAVGAAGGDAVAYSKISALSEETAPAAGDWLLGEESGGAVRKFDVGDLPYPVDSVFSRTGAVTAASNDYTWAQIDKTTSDVADLTTKSHTSLSDIGSTSHGDIDTHVGAANPHSGSAASGANSDITSLAGLTTPLSISQGGTAAASFTVSQLVRMNSGGTAFESSGKTVPTGSIVGTTDTQTLTNKTISAASNKMRFKAGFGMESPVATDQFSVVSVEVASVITKLRLHVRGSSPSVAWTVKYGSDTAAAGTTVATGTATSTSGHTVTSFSNSTPALNDWIWVVIGTVSGTVSEFHLDVFYRDS